MSHATWIAEVVTHVQSRAHQLLLTENAEEFILVEADWIKFLTEVSPHLVKVLKGMLPTVDLDRPLGDTLKERNRLRSERLMIIFGKDVLKETTDDDAKEGLRAALMSLLAFIQHGQEWFPRLSEAIQKRFLKWVLKKDPQISGMVRLDMLREYGFDATGLAVIGKDTLYRAMWLILESEYDHLTQ
jgi:hypothetical protein